MAQVLGALDNPLHGMQIPPLAGLPQSAQTCLSMSFERYLSIIPRMR